MLGLPLLACYAAQLALIMCSERAQEAEHATIKRDVKNPRHNPVLVPLSRRAVMLERMLNLQPEILHNIIGAFARVRACKDLPTLIGCGLHPEIVKARDH